MDSQVQKQIEEQGRQFMQPTRRGMYTDFISDQALRLEQPALVKEAQGSTVLALPRDFQSLNLNQGLEFLLRCRQSKREYLAEAVTLLELSFALWACQGIKGLRGKRYATLRTVPSGGARHPFECYFYASNVEGLKPGIYHYLPLKHEIELVSDLPVDLDFWEKAVHGQRFVTKAAVIFFFTAIPRRAEWRYGIHAHRIALVDLGHVGENLYLAATALGLGTCGIGAFDSELCNQLLAVDGEKEFTVYLHPLGRINPEDLDSENAFYQFVLDQDL